MDVSTNAVMDTKGKRRTNKRWPEALKREIVAASFAPGASVAMIALHYDVNVNQVFSWRHRYGPAVEAVAPPTPPAPRPRLVPVTIGVEPEGSAALSGIRVPAIPSTSKFAGTYLVRVGVNFDDRALRRVLECLARAGGLPLTLAEATPSILRVCRLSMKTTSPRRNVGARPPPHPRACLEAFPIRRLSVRASGLWSG